MKFLSNCFKGILIGSGAILPGISSGVFCVIFGIYEKLLDSILNFFTDIKSNFKFLFPITIGIGFGIILFGNLLNYCLYKFPVQSKCTFIGLILGSIPTLIKEASLQKKIKFSNLFFFFLALFIGIFCVWIENTLTIQTLENINFAYLILCGFLMSIGIVVPGISSTIILMLLGIYPIYLSSVSNVYFPILIPLGIGIFIGSICFMKIIQYLLAHFYSPTFYCIIGFSVGSLFVLLPSICSTTDFTISTLSITLGFCLASLFKNVPTRTRS